MSLCPAQKTNFSHQEVVMLVCVETALVLGIF